jgi:hypothetical protein
MTSSQIVQLATLNRRLNDARKAGDVRCMQQIIREQQSILETAYGLPLAS